MKAVALERVSTSLDQTVARDDLQLCLEVWTVADGESRLSAREWATELGPWEQIVERSRSIWGRQWAHFVLANIASGIRSSDEKCTEYADLFHDSVSLCRRARYARLRAGSWLWWQRQFRNISDELDAMFLSLLLLTWGSAATIARNLPALDSALDRLSVSEWMRLTVAVNQALDLTREQAPHRDLMFGVASLPKELSPRTVTAIGIRAKMVSKRELFGRFLWDYQGTDPVILEFCQQMALDLHGDSRSSWERSLGIIRNSYEHGVISEPSALYEMMRHMRTNPLPLDIAEEITNHPEQYPGYLVAAAEGRVRRELAKRVMAVAEVAKVGGWFKPEKAQ